MIGYVKPNENGQESYRRGPIQINLAEQQVNVAG